jgi:DNA-binding LytR/AlgR family response regulator
LPRALIAEDEPLLRAQLKTRLLDAWPELELVGEAETGEQAFALINELKPDVVFLDIRMPAASGIDVARRLGGRFHIVFVTAYDEYAVAAFEQGAVDYVLKPFTAARLATTVGRLKDRLLLPPPDLSELLVRLSSIATQGSYLRWINASVGKAVKLITVDEICYFQADNKYTLVVTPQSESLIHKTIKELADELDPQVFWQIHRATVVNVNAIANVERNVRGRVSVKLKERKESLPVADAYVHLFRQM